MTAASTPPGGTAARASTPASAPGRGDGVTGRGLHERLHEQERAEIVGAIEQAQGNIALAARTLGINRSTLYYRLRKHGLEHLLPLKEPAAPTEGPAGAAPGGPSE